MQSMFVDGYMNIIVRSGWITDINRIINNNIQVHRLYIIIILNHMKHNKWYDSMAFIVSVSSLNIWVFVLVFFKEIWLGYPLPHYQDSANNDWKFSNSFWSLDPNDDFNIGYECITSKHGAKFQTIVLVSSYVTIFAMIYMLSCVCRVYVGCGIADILVTFLLITTWSNITFTDVYSHSNYRLASQHFGSYIPISE